MKTDEYISDLDRLTRNPDDEVRMTGRAFLELKDSVNIIDNNQIRIESNIKDVRSRVKQNSELIDKVEQIISSLNVPKKKSKFGTKSNLLPAINFIASADRYEEELAKAPKCSLTPVPNYFDLIKKIAEKIPNF